MRQNRIGEHKIDRNIRFMHKAVKGIAFGGFLLTLGHEALAGYGLRFRTTEDGNFIQPKSAKLTIKYHDKEYSTNKIFKAKRGFTIFSIESVHKKWSSGTPAHFGKSVKAALQKDSGYKITVEFETTDGKKHAATAQLSTVPDYLQGDSVKTVLDKTEIEINAKTAKAVTHWPTEKIDEDGHITDDYYSYAKSFNKSVENYHDRKKKKQEEEERKQNDTPTQKMSSSSSS